MNDLACHSCKKVHPDAKPITLPNGQTVGNYSQDYLTHTEAKWVYAKAKNRSMYLEAVKQKRGLPAYEKLRNAMLKIHFGTK